ncbi:MAG: amidohydrolase family protein [Bacteroidales bacterium]|nr:amidohydrolase family protein [Bacteroidales bacterium]
MKNYIIICVLLLASCSEQPDFATFPKIDAHAHLETSDDSFVELLRENNFILLSLVTRSVSQPLIDEEFNYARELYKGHPESIAFATTFSMDGFGEPAWEERTIEWLEESFSQGAIAVKVWKDIGMTFLDKDSSYIMIDDARFDPIWDLIKSQNKTLVNHVGEPKNCWLPLEEMTVRGDSSYFAHHPDYHMYLHPGAPSYEALIAARDHVLEKHPDLRFVGCHLGSLEYDVDEQAKRLDKYPNFSMDMAARISHFKVQDRDKVRAFFIEYQDRLLYGTDIGIRNSYMEGTSLARMQEIVEETYLNDWEYFTTDKILEQNDKVKTYQGLDLPIKVLKKIYCDNAKRMYPEIGMRH